MWKGASEVPEEVVTTAVTVTLAGDNGVAREVGSSVVLVLVNVLESGVVKVDKVEVGWLVWIIDVEDVVDKAVEVPLSATVEDELEVLLVLDEVAVLVDEVVEREESVPEVAVGPFEEVEDVGEDGVSGLVVRCVGVGIANEPCRGCRSDRNPGMGAQGPLIVRGRLGKPT